jgi:hypothetical protein
MSTPVPNLEITIDTGSDNLRGDSSSTAYVVVVHGNGTEEFSTMLKTETENEWANGSTHGPIVWNLPADINEDHISRFGIRMQSHENGAETSDNWNINSVLVTYPDGSGGRAVLVDEAGGPLARLTGSEPQWEAVLTT